MTQMYKSNRARFILASKGFAMGVADVIPGVSGGTIAFISGIYTHLIHSITSIKPIHAISFFQLFHPQKRALALNKLKEVEWNFLITLFAGVITAILTMARIIPFFMKEYPFYTYSLFFGLILFSIYIPYKNMKKDNLNFIILLASAIGMFLLMGPAQALTGSTNIFYVFITGAIAICAMILPGLSGSYLLVLFGQYVIVLDALRSKNFAIIIPFILGIIIGILSFSRLLKYLLTYYHSYTMAALTGIMIGSLRKIWPGNFAPETGVDTSMIGFAFALILLGGLFIMGLEYISRTLNDPEAPILSSTK